MKEESYDLNFIKKNLYKKERLIDNLNIIRKISKNKKYSSVLYWINAEIEGYDDKEFRLPYRKIRKNVLKHASKIIPERLDEKLEYITEPIEKLVKFSEQEKITYTTTNFWGTPLTITIHRTEFDDVLHGVMRKIADFILLYEKDPKLISKEFNFLPDDNYEDFKDKTQKEIIDIDAGKLKIFFEDHNEREIFKENIKDLIRFEYEKKYKFAIIQMGSILEFLLLRYYKVNSIDLNLVNGKKTYYHFSVLLKQAIKIKLMNEKKRWEIIQFYLRDFRNHIHLIKEMNEEKIDEKWYETLKPVFEVLYNKFKQL